MQHSAESFWIEIKAYEERLKADPSSHCFAALAELYLQVGLVDDALAVSRSGVAKHPEYLSGQLAFARACLEKGLREEGCQALEQVVAADPAQSEAQRLVARLYADAGRNADAVRALQALLDRQPDDVAARIELEALQRGGVVDDDELELIELTELDIYEEPAEGDRLVERERPPVQTPLDDPWGGLQLSQPAPAAVVADPWVGVAEQVTVPAAADPWASPVVSASLEASAGMADPLKTATLAELYVAQGFAEKALEIYRDILAADPANPVIRQRISELEAAPVGELPGEQPASVVCVPAQGEADAATVAVLEGWLENIRRIRECR